MLVPLNFYQKKFEAVSTIFPLNFLKYPTVHLNLINTGIVILLKHL